jgi:D-alanine-D-alanine ligase
LNQVSSHSPKIKVGILFGGNSREREVSFAGGRTVYDLLNKSIFEALPIFVDSFGQLVELDWPYLYKGSIRDFYPSNLPFHHQPKDSLAELSKEGSSRAWMPYAEQHEEAHLHAEGWRKAIGKPLAWEDLSHRVDLVFMALHGRNGEDGRVQSILDFWDIPYTGCGPRAASWAMNKVAQRHDMQAAGWDVPKFMAIPRADWVGENASAREQWVGKIISQFPNGCVVKAANQGSSIGLTMLRNVDTVVLEEAIDKAFFTAKISKEEYQKAGDTALDRLADFRTGIGFPLRDRTSGTVWFSPTAWEYWFLHEFTGDVCDLESLDSETDVLIEEIIVGKEFSCIVLEKSDATVSALPPTEITSSQEFYDYRSKYLPGLARKKTPIDLPDEQIHVIRRACEQLFKAFDFSVYARIDGFVTPAGRIYLNDPNTTSGMMPSSFFFQQAAEIGLGPSAFLTYIISASLNARIQANPTSIRCVKLAEQLRESLHQAMQGQGNRKRIGVLMGGYSSERHISVESGRNIYEKISSTEGYEPISLFLSGNAQQWDLHELPMHLHLKDNADDILAGIREVSRPRVIGQIRNDFKEILETFAPNALEYARPLAWEDLANQVDFVFIALHGRPGEDGALQERLDTLGLPYNGSGVQSSSLTIDKYLTGQALRASGLQVAEQRRITSDDWQKGINNSLLVGEGIWPMIAKPLDDGCSTAVYRLTCREELEAYAQLTFREDDQWPMEAASLLKVPGSEWFNRSKAFLLEEFISERENEYFLEITGAMLVASKPGGHRDFEVFEPSESIAGEGILSLEEKFLAGQGTNITPARFSVEPFEQNRIMGKVQDTLRKAAEVAGVEGYCRIDAFVGIPKAGDIRVVIIEINSLPGMTPATCIYHQAALAGYTPHQFIERIIALGFERKWKP